MNLRKGFQPRINLVKSESGDLLTDSRSILNRLHYLSQLLNVHRVSDRNTYS
jgi:hypothetical protein